MRYKFQKLVGKAVGYLWHRHRFSQFGSGSFIIRPIAISGQSHISIGHQVRIRDHLRMEAIAVKRRPQLVIGDHTNIEQNVHIICSHSVRIGKNCSITARCAIVDTWHPFTHIGADKKIGDGLNAEPGEVIIGDNCFLGIGAVIQPNVRLGQRCVVGANAVVLAGTYPDGAVLAGAPARVVRVVPPEDY